MIHIHEDTISKSQNSQNHYDINNSNEKRSCIIYGSLVNLCSATEWAFILFGCYRSLKSLVNDRDKYVGFVNILTWWAVFTLIAGLRNFPVSNQTDAALLTRTNKPVQSPAMALHAAKHSTVTCIVYSPSKLVQHRLNQLHRIDFPLSRKNF